MKKLERSEELIKDLRLEINKCEISIKKENRTKLEKEYLNGMINAYRRSIFHIEINYSSKIFEQTHEENTEKWREKI